MTVWVGVFLALVGGIFVVLMMVFQAASFWLLRRRYPQRYEELGSPPLVPRFSRFLVQLKARRRLRRLVRAELKNDRGLAWLVRLEMVCRLLAGLSIIALTYVELSTSFFTR
jgi:hypothetical protein